MTLNDKKNTKNVVLIRMKSYLNIKTPPLGIGYLLKAIKNIEGINPIFIDLQRDKLKEENLLNKLKKLNPLIIGLQVFSLNYTNFCKLIQKIKQNCPKATIIAGGPHVSGLPEQTLIDNPELNYVIKGEGEETLKQLTINLIKKTLNKNINKIPNLVHRTKKGIKKNKLEFTDVNEYGAPAWEIIQPEKYPAIQHGTFHKTNKVVPILTSRGCPYPCTYCAGHVLTGKKIRTRNTKSIVDEIELLQSKYGFKEFLIEDENFTFYKDHILNLSKEIKNRNIKCYFSFPNGVRLDKLDEEIIYHLKRMGTYIVCLGIESGSNKTLKAMKKDLNLDMVREKIKLLKKYKILVGGSFILGFCNETMEDLKKTINFAVNSDLDMAYFGNYIPLPGSEDFNRMINEGELKLDEIDWNEYSSFFGRIPYNPKDISKEQLLKAIKKGTMRFYSRPKILFNIVKRISHPIFLKSLIFRGITLFHGNKK